MTEDYWLDTDNALGSPRGDIDDAIAITALYKAKASVIAVSNVFGNTEQALSFRNTEELLKNFNFQGPQWAGANLPGFSPTPASQALAKIKDPVTIIALGPLTNLAAALLENPKLKEKIKQIIFVGLNYDFPVPTWRFFDFNVYKDKASAAQVFKMGIPMVIVPCNVARKIRMSPEDLQRIAGPVGDYIRANSGRWFRRSRFLKLRNHIPVWDLCAVMYALEPALFDLEPAQIRTTRLGSLLLEPGPKDSHLVSVTGFRSEVRARAFELLQLKSAH